MTVVNFRDKPVFTNDTSTWPESPDRSEHGAGREFYAAEDIQSVLTGTPETTITLTEFFGEELGAYETFTPSHYGRPLFVKDPLPELMKKLSGTGYVIEDDTWEPSDWDGTGDPVEKYMRLGERIPGVVLYVGGPTITDMNQLQLGNCGFVSSIGAASLHPQAHNILFSSVYPPVYNPAGIYSIRITDDGRVGYMLIDDRVPDAGYSSTWGKEGWYLLVEKGCAKAGGGYRHIGGFHKSMGLTAVNEMSVTASNMDQVWEQHFLPAFRDRSLVSYYGTTYVPDLEDYHAYAVIDAAEWNGIRLVRLHNPWNYIESDNGWPYAPGSADWDAIPENVQKEIFQVDRYQGRTFWLTWEMYVKNLAKFDELVLQEGLPETLLSIAAPVPIQDNHYSIQAAVNLPDEQALFFLRGNIFSQFSYITGRTGPYYPLSVDDLAMKGLAPFADLIIGGVSYNNEKAYLFLKDNRYIRYDLHASRMDEGYPKDINDKTWPGMKAYANDIVSIFKWTDTLVTFLLTKNRYIHFSLYYNRIEGDVKELNDENWPGLGTVADKIFTALKLNDNQVAFFTRDNQYAVFNIHDHQVESGYPKPVNETTWPGLLY